MDKSLIEQIGAAGIVAVITLEEAESVIPLAEALFEGGVSSMELTLRTEAGLPAIEACVRAVPDMMVGAGTVLTPEQVNRVKEAGAAFGVAPGFNPTTIQAAEAANLPFAPGICTPSELEAAHALGCKVLKFFPAEPSGGLAYLKSMSAPYAHLGVHFIPLGGLNIHNAASYLAMNNVLALGGSWIAPTKDIREGNWKTITSRALEARHIIDSIKSPQK